MSDTPKPRRTRVDALHNRDQILRAAVDLLVEDGPTVALESIARRASIGIATLYRHFPDRSVLFREVALDLLRHSTKRTKAALTEESDAFTALVRYMHEAIDLRIAAIMPIVTERAPTDVELRAARDEARLALDTLVKAAQDEGALRRDVGSADISMLVTRVALPLPAISREDNHRLSHRHLEIVLDGLLRFVAADSLPGGGPLTLNELSTIHQDAEGTYQEFLSEAAVRRRTGTTTFVNLSPVRPDQNFEILSPRPTALQAAFPQATAEPADNATDKSDDHVDQTEDYAVPQPSGGVTTASRTGTFLVSIYLSDEAGHEAVEAAVSHVMELSGAPIIERDDPILGSWFRRMQASSTAREIGMSAAHVVDNRLVHAPDAQVTATLLQHVGPVITALQTSKEAVVRLGAVLIVKVDEQLVVHQLTAAQQFQLEHHPQLAMQPRNVLATLGLPPTTSHYKGPVTT